MDLLAFRIFNFRSITDSGWVDFSRDGVTVLVGQNESGKTSVLQALHCALGTAAITSDDKRINAPDPVFHVRARVTFEEVDGCGALDEATVAERSALKEYLATSSDVVELSLWRVAKPPAQALTELHKELLDEERYTSLYQKALATELIETSSEMSEPDPITAATTNLAAATATSAATTVAPTTSTTSAPTATPTTSAAAAPAATKAGEADHEPFDAAAAADAFYQMMPLATLFSAETGLLPNTVDIDDKDKPAGTGAIAAANYLAIADIDLPSLVKGDGRYRQNILHRANQRLTEDFASFWSQVIGSKSRLTLQCAFEIYGTAAGDKVGKPYLEFWISDGNTQLYPRQRSQGVRWFVSFYLQLRATEKSKYSRIFLLDEPGANLHDKAQQDVLRLIDTLRKEIPIVYSTHSPKMIEYEKLFRIRAVQRDGDKEDSPTAIIDAHHLGAASSDTLSPLLSAMGSDMSQQAVIKKRRNVLLEEISGYYYLTAFWKLLDRSEEAYFIAATGVNKVPQLANMFLGWGLDFVAAVDDDKQGREVYNQLKKELAGDKDDLAKRFLLKFPGCPAIEEVFTKLDFKRHVLRDEKAKCDGTNADFLKENRISKPLVALEFKLAADRGTIEIKMFEEATQAKMRELTQSICDLLARRDEKGSVAKK